MDTKLIRSSDNDAGLEKARADVCSKIIQILDNKKLSTRDAEKLTGISHLILNFQESVMPNYNGSL